MARHIWNRDLQTRSARLALPPRKRHYNLRLGGGINQQYWRGARGGTWFMALADGKGKQKITRIGRADDYAEANNSDVLTFQQAQNLILRLAHGHTTTAPVTLSAALDNYATHLRTEAHDVGNARRVRKHLPKRLLDRTVLSLTTQDFRDLRAATAAKVETPRTATRIFNGLKAALNQCARADRRLDPTVWTDALKPLGSARGIPNNVVLPAATIAKIVKAAYAESTEFGLLVELLACSGNRPSQIKNVLVRDLQADRIMVPVSAKGNGLKSRTHTAVPIPPTLAKRLRLNARGRASNSPLLLQPDGRAWDAKSHAQPFESALIRAGIDPRKPRRLTAYVLRHSFVTAALLKNTPLASLAQQLDTSPKELTRTYAAFIADHSDSVMRAVMPDFGDSEAADDVVVPLNRSP